VWYYCILVTYIHPHTRREPTSHEDPQKTKQKDELFLRNEEKRVTAAEEKRFFLSTEEREKICFGEK